MGFLTSIIEALARFVQRHPLTTLFIVVLALIPSALLRGIALFVLWLVFGLLVLVVAGALFFRWRIRAVQREMERQFGEGFGPRPGSGFGSRFAGGAAGGREGEVKVHRTPGAPDKRVSSDVGDYVDFEETEE
ncbi:MAG: DUF4834 domain-containing protein [Alistipes sp.]|nr:DUF4834 domain-containing protein [Alistipes sp.]